MAFSLCILEFTPVTQTTIGRNLTDATPQTIRRQLALQYHTHRYSFLDKDVDPVPISDPTIAQHSQEHDKDSVAQAGAAHVQADSNGRSDPEKTLIALLACNGVPNIGAVVDNGNFVHPRGEVVHTAKQLPVAGVAGPGLHRRDLEKPSQATAASRNTQNINPRGMRLETPEIKLRIKTRPGTPANTYAKLRVAGIRRRGHDVTFNSLHILNERDPAPVPPRTGSGSGSASASSSHDQNWPGVSVPNRGATTRIGLQAIAGHYKPWFDEAKEARSATDEWQEEVNKSKDTLSDATYAYYMSDHKPRAEKDRLQRAWNRAASEHSADRMFCDMAQKKLIAQTRPGTPANTYAKLCVAGVKPLKKRNAAPSPPRTPSAAPRPPAVTLSANQLAEKALQVVADYTQAGIPAAQTRTNQASEAFEKSQHELDGAAKALKKPFIEAMFHSQQQGWDMNRRYRSNNRAQHRENQHLRVLHETVGKLRDTGIGPRDMKRKRPGLEDALNLNYTALSIVAQHSHMKLPEAKQQLLQTAKKARKTKTELDLQHERHFDDAGDQPSWDLMDQHYGNVEGFDQARKNLFHLKNTLNKLDKVGIRPRSPAGSGAGQSNDEPHPLAREALGIIAQHSQRRVEDAFVEHRKAMAKVGETGGMLAEHHLANTLNTPSGLELLRQHRANILEQSRTQNLWMSQYRHGGPAKIIAGLRMAFKGIVPQTHHKRSPTPAQTRRQNTKDALEVVRYPGGQRKANSDSQ
ncbi:hypothetical protein MMC30_005039 [Trapelia coarctata]|nr:hypothetical protein [Trapelia coarctata]